MRSFVLSLSAFAIAAVTLSGCCGTLVQGEVRNMDHHPIEGARITVDETGAVRHTNADGRYAVALPCRAEPFLIRVIADGYPEISDVIDSPGGHVTRNYTVGGDRSKPAEPRRAGAPPPVEQRYEEPEPTYEPEPEPEPVRRPPPARRDPPRSTPQRAETPARPCPDCMTDIPAGDTHCPSCGARYLGDARPSRRPPARPGPRPRPRPAQPEPASEPEPEPMEPMRADTGGKICPACGTSVAQGERDCSGCGATVYDQ